MRKLLTLKHWQLFWLVVGFIIINQSFVVFSILTKSIAFKPLSLILSVSLYGFLFGWIYTLGTNLHKKLPDTAKMNLTMFKVFLFIPAIYILFVTLIMKTKIDNMLRSEHLNVGFVFVFILLHLFTMYCILYCLYFNAKALKTVELKKNVTFNQFSEEFFLLWFYPIGIWTIQPRINKLFDPTLNANTNPL